MKARVLKSTGSWYNCQFENGNLISARIKGKLRLKGVKTTNPIAVGDYVEIDNDEDSESAIISEIYKRDNYIIRKSPRNLNKHQILAANIDQLFVMATLKSPRTSTGFIDRLLMVAEMHHIDSVILFNKKDIYGTKEMTKFSHFKEVYESVGYDVHLISNTDESSNLFLQELMKDKTSMISGHSGAGKSTLINKLIPNLNIATKEISNFSDKGLHTTSFAEMHPLPLGGHLIDTPGIKELEAVSIEPEEISHYFPEMRDLLEHCKFNNCRHQNEPKCAVIEAFENGEIAEFRYINYMKILDDLLDIDYWER